jgi:hypothetical protein
MNMDVGPLGNVPFTQATVRLHSIKFDTDFTLRIAKKDLPGGRTTARARSIRVSEGANVGGLLSRYEGLVFGTATPVKWKRTPETPDKSETGFSDRYLPTTRLHVGESRRATRSAGALTEDLLDEYFAEAVTALWTRYTSDVVREVRDAQEKGLANILRGVLAGASSRPGRTDALDLERGYESARKFLERQGSPNALGTLAQFQKRFAQDKLLQKIVTDIFRIEQAIDKATEPQRKLESLIQRMYGGNKTISFSDTAILVQDPSGVEIGLASLSSGEKHLTQLFVESLLVRESAILIDEPEISIHVDWQRELVADFRSLNPEAQFILATHSPEVMSEVEDDKIFAL